MQGEVDIARHLGRIIRTNDHTPSEPLSERMEELLRELEMRHDALSQKLNTDLDVALPAQENSSS